MRKVLLSLLVVPVLAVASCSEIEERISNGVNDVAARALERGVSEQLARAGVELDGEPDCTTDLTRDGATLVGTASCDATTADGHDATASFDGTLSSSGCEGSLRVDVGGEKVIDLAEIPDCSVNF